MGTTPLGLAETEPRSNVPPEWYEAAFDADYLRIYRRRTRAEAIKEAEFVARALSLRPGTPILDLGCGAGRHLEPLLARGLRVVGLDRSTELLREARRCLARPGDFSKGSLVQGDMRELPFSSGFAAVLSFFSSFGYFFDDDENDRVLGEIARVLEPRGRFFLDLMNRTFVMTNLVPLSEREENGVTIRERRWISADGKRVEKEIHFRDDSQPRRFHESVRLYSLPEVEKTLSVHRLEVEHLWGDFDGSRYSPDKSPRMLITGRRHDP